MEGWWPEWVEPLPDNNVVSVQGVGGDELIHRIFEIARVRFDFGYSGNSRVIQVENEDRRIDEWKFNTPDGAELSRLWVLNDVSSLRLFVAGVGDVGTDGGIPCWQACVNGAVEAMGKRSDVPWVAIVCESPQRMMVSAGQQLSRAVKFGDLAFAPLTHGVAEQATMNMSPIGLHISEFFHWPITVRGSTACFDWDTDGAPKAMERLRLIVALLTLEWDSYWQLREGPRDPEITFADFRSPLMGNSWQPLSEGSPFSGAPISIPRWILDAERAAGNAVTLQRALLMHHEGMGLRREHPSMALVAFFAVIEAIAQITKKPTKCPECGSHTSSAERFRVAVSEVLPEQHAEVLHRAYGPKRSYTVHQARLHGTESQFGGFGLVSLFVNDPGFEFDHSELAIAQKASRLLLRRALEKGVGRSLA